MAADRAGQEKDKEKDVTGPFFHVNKDRKGQVEAGGEELTGSEILARVGLTAERYELFPVEGGRVGEAVGGDTRVRVKPGDHFRATLRGADYSREDGAR
jgi:hypothetical protein